MQTFLPLWGTGEAAAALDNARLGKQRVESLQIMKALTTGKGWIHHPATKMWAGYEQSLLVYTFTMCDEWTARGYADSVRDKIEMLFDDYEAEGGKDYGLPWWWGDETLALSHRSNLIRKAPEYYGSQWAGCPADLEYIWPQGAGHTGSWFIGKPGLKRISAGELRHPLTFLEPTNG